MNPFELHGAAYLSFYLAALATGAVTALILRGMILERDDDRSVPSSAIARELDPYEAAFLVGGKDRAFVTACATLARHNVITIDRSSRSLTLIGSAGNSRMRELESAIVSRAQAQGGTVSFDTARKSVAGTIDQIRRSLINRGLATEDDRRFCALFIPWLWYLGVALVFSLPKIAMAENGHYPHGHLVMLTFYGCIASLAFFIGGAKTNKGGEVARALQGDNSALRLTAQTNPAGLSWRDTALAYAVFGSVALVGDPFADVLYGMRMQRSNGAGGCGSGSSCGSSCGSGCGGGGCGGGCGG